MAHIKHLTTVVRDGHHNAFTDLQYWQGCYWVAYRKGAGHISMDANAAISVSSDRQRFREVAHLRMPGDNRDPKLLPIDDHRMVCYFPSWVRGVGPRELQQYISFSADGFHWNEPVAILEPQHWLWRIRRHEGRYYALIQNLARGWSDGTPPHELDLAVSDDLMTWQTIACIGNGKGLCESDIHWQSNGEAWVVARTAKQTPDIGSYFAKAKPPYTDWQITPLKPICHAPVFIEHDGVLFVAGRSNPAHDGDTAFPFDKSSSTAVWRVTDGRIDQVLRIPASGDCSYPGLIKDPEGRICMSYYSQHAYSMGILQPAFHPDPSLQHSPADVYFAELDLYV